MPTAPRPRWPDVAGLTWWKLNIHDTSAGAKQLHSAPSNDTGVAETAAPVNPVLPAAAQP